MADTSLLSGFFADKKNVSWAAKILLLKKEGDQDV